MLPITESAVNLLRKQVIETNGCFMDVQALGEEGKKKVLDNFNYLDSKDTIYYWAPEDAYIVKLPTTDNIVY